MADVTFRNPELLQNLEKMLNNPKYSDVVFLVNERKFHVSSHLVCFSSHVLESILDTHYENCRDHEIRVGEVKYTESFSVILNFIYGVEINFTQMKKETMSEVLGLSERFDLKLFTKELRSYLTNIEHFEVDFLVVFLNTAKKFHLKDFYEKLKNFAFIHTDELVKNKDFVNLQYDVLLDLFKADCFCAKEIDILMGALKWHANNIMSEDDCEGVIEKVADVHLDDIDKEEGVQDPSNGAMVSEEVTKSNAENNNPINESSISLPKDKSGSVLKEFSRNILKKLLSYIRISRISGLDLLHLIETENCSKYKEFLSDYSLFSPISEPRNKIVQYIKKDVQNVTQKFTVAYTDLMQESQEEYLIGDMKWKLSSKSTTIGNSNYTVDMYLTCKSEAQELQEWECTTECQLKMFPCFSSPNSPTLYLPAEDIHTSIVLTSDNSCVKVGTFFYRINSWNYIINGQYTFEVHFKSIHCQLKVNHN